MERAAGQRASRIRPVIGIVAATSIIAAMGAESKAAPKKANTANTQQVSRGDSGRPHIDIVFAIDCSGSMGGVIEAAKQKVWDIVNEVARAKPSPVLRIGLIGYGDAARTFRTFDLSDDLDTVYGHLMTFKDEGWSEEYVGTVVQKATQELSWSRNSDGPSLRVIYVVGNETAQQGPVNFQDSTPLAVQRGLKVNAIYCGSAGGQDTWQQMSALGKGQFLQIAASGGSVLIPTPYDAQLAQLSAKLNSTYLAYGKEREEAARNQVAQDANAALVGGTVNAASRAMAKSSRQYSNSRWDLVDASRDKNFDLDKVPADQLPPEMRAMTPAQRRAHITKRAKERAALQAQINALGLKRDAFLRSARKKRRPSSGALDDAITGSVRSQAAANGFKFGK